MATQVAELDDSSRIALNDSVLEAGKTRANDKIATEQAPGPVLIKRGLRAAFRVCRLSKVREHILERRGNPSSLRVSQTSKSDATYDLIPESHSWLRLFYRSIASQKPRNVDANGVMLWTSEVSRWRLSTVATYARCFAVIHDELAKASAGNLRVLAVSADVEYVWKAIPFLYKVWFTIWQRGTDAKRTVSLVLALLVVKHWVVTPADLKAVRGYLPGFRKSIVDHFYQRARTADGSVKKYTFEEKPWAQIDDHRLTSHPRTLVFRWLRTLPAFPGDLEIYVEQPLRERPNIEWVHVLFFEQRESDSRRNVLLQASSGALLGRISKRWRSSPSITLSSADQSLWLVHTLLEQVSADLTVCAANAIEYIDDMVRDPCASMCPWCRWL